MTRAEMILLFHQRYDDSSFTNPELGDDEVDLYLNLSTERFINTRFTGNNFRQVGFEEDQKRIDDVRTLLTNSAILTGFTAGEEISNSQVVDISSLTNYRFYIKSFSRIDKTVGGVPSTDAWVPNQIIGNHETDQFTRTIFHSPIIDNPRVVFRDGDMTVIYDQETTLTGFKLQYIRQPATITSGQDSDLPDHTHEEIVEGAVSLALETIESRRNQTEQVKVDTVE